MTSHDEIYAGYKPNKNPLWYNYAGHESKHEHRKCVIIDLDGTTFNNKHRQHFLEGDKKDWKSFFEATPQDTPNAEIVWLVQTMFKASDAAIIFCTGRPSQYNEMTMDQMATHQVPYSYLLMRAQGDGRPDAIVKQDMLDAIRSRGFIPILSIDDRPEVVDMWRNRGVPTLACDATDWKRRTASNPDNDPLIWLNNQIAMGKGDTNMLRTIADMLERKTDAR